MLKSGNDLAERNLLITKNLLITLYTEIYPTTYLKYTITSYENISIGRFFILELYLLFREVVSIPHQMYHTHL